MPVKSRRLRPIKHLYLGHPERGSEWPVLLRNLEGSFERFLGHPPLQG